MPTNGTTPIQLFIAKADVPYSGYVTATISDPNWTLVEETSAGFLFSYNPSVTIAASGGMTS